MSTVDQSLGDHKETDPLQRQVQLLQKENQDVHRKYTELEQQYISAQKEIEQLKEAQLSANGSLKMQHSAEFWIDIKDKVIRDPDYIKGLVKHKKMTLQDTDTYNRTLLGISAQRGSYSMVQFCLNGGSDISHKDYDQKTALNYAISNGYHHIQQLLLFSQMNVSSGNKIKDIANAMNTQKGINQNVCRQLTDIGEETKRIFESAVVTVMINLITLKLSFDDTLLNMAWDIACDDTKPLSSDLWKSIALTCANIFHSGDERDWYWFKSFLLPSTIWFRTINEANDTSCYYLYFELLNLVDEEAKVQLTALETDLNELANKYPGNWEKLITWDEPNDYTIARQDRIPNGIQSDYTYSQLLEKSDAQFNAHKFYDYNHYLSELVLLAQIVDDDFQNSVQKIFKINRNTQIGRLHDDEKSDDVHRVEYRRGPVKLMERARAKASQDYFLEAYPTTACIVDMNRCTLIFSDIRSLLFALKLFVNKMRYFQSGCIIGMVRNKNGFADYIEQTQYADVKLNVLIKGTKNNIIGEIQFLLQIMEEFKAKAHNLYIVQRQKEYVQNSVSKLLPTLLDEETQLFIAGSMNDVRGLCRLMTIHNWTGKDLIRQNKEDQTILLHACELGNERVFLFLKSILSADLFVHYLFSAAIYDDKPIEMAVGQNQPSIVRHLFAMKEVQERYNENDNELFRLFYHLFGQNTEMKAIDYVLSQLKIPHDKVAYMMYYAYNDNKKKRIPANGHQYARRRLVSFTVASNKLSIVKKLVSIIGEKTFINASFLCDYTNLNAMEYAINHEKMAIIEYMLSFEEIKQKYTFDDELYRLVYWLLGRCLNEEIVDYVRKELKISDEKISLLLTYEYPAPSAPVPKAGVIRYHQYTILGTMIRRKPVSAVKKLVSMIGEQHFVECVFTPNGININSIEFAIAVNKMEVMQYFLSFESIKERYLSDNALLFRLIYWLFGRCRENAMMDYVLSQLNLNGARALESLVSTYLYELYPSPEGQLPSNAIRYEKSIISGIVCSGTLTSLKKLQSMIGEAAFIDGVILSNNQNVNALEFALTNSKQMFVEYLLSIGAIQQIYLNTTDLLFRLIYCLFVKQCKKRMIDYVLSQLNLSNKHTLETLLSHQYPPPSDEENAALAPDAVQYDEWTILSAIVCNNCNADSLRRIVSIIGAKSFSDAVFNDDRQRDVNTIEYAISCGKKAMIEYMLSFAAVGQRYLNDDAVLFRLLYWLFARNDDEKMIDFVFSQLAMVPHNRIVQIVTQYEYPPPSVEQYHSRSMIGAIVSLQKNTVRLLKKFVSLFGAAVFVDAAFVADCTNCNALEYVIRYNEMATMQYMLSFDAVKLRFAKDNHALFRLLYWLLVRCKEDTMPNYVLATLHISRDKLAHAITHPPPINNTEYDQMTIIAAAANTLQKLKRIQNTLGDETFCDALFCEASDAGGKSAMQCVLQNNNNLKIIKYLMSIHDVREKWTKHKNTCDIGSYAMSDAMKQCIKDALDAHQKQWD
eukprot:258100_1